MTVPEQDFPWWKDLLRAVIGDPDSDAGPVVTPGVAHTLIGQITEGAEREDALREEFAARGQVLPDPQQGLTDAHGAPIVDPRDGFSRDTGTVRAPGTNADVWGVQSPPRTILTGDAPRGGNDMETGNVGPDLRPAGETGGFGRFISEFERNFLDKVSREYIAAKLPDRLPTGLSRGEFDDKRTQKAFREFVKGGGQFTDPGDRSPTGGRGGGRPKYVAPDRRTVEEWVTDKLIILTGQKQPEMEAIIDSYMSAHKSQFEGKSIDPAAEAVEKIRGLAEYQRIHTLRPDAADENTWVSSRQNRLTQLGVGAKDAASRGIALAATGASAVDIDAGKFQLGKGRQDITMMNRLEKVAEQIAGNI